MKIALVLSILVLALIFFVCEWLPVDLTAILVTVVLMLLGLVTPEEGISGFGNTATITVMAMFILSHGIARTGAIQVLRDLLLKWGGKNITQQILVMGILTGSITAFINNTAVVAVFLPIVEEWCRKQNISVSKLLMPLSFTTILGGMITVIGTSTNILASGLSKQLGYGEFRLFQFTTLGLITFTIGLTYLAFVAPKLIPIRKAPSRNLEDYALKDYVTEVVVTPRSSLIGKTLSSTQLEHKFDLDVLELIRNDRHFRQSLGDKVLLAGDVFIVRGTRKDLLKIRDEKGLDILPEVLFKEESIKAKLTSEEESVAEVLILSNSRLVGSTLKDWRFRQRYNATVLAIKRGQQLIRERLSQLPLHFGDLLLVQGSKESFLGLQTTPEFLVLEQIDQENLRYNKAPIAVAIGLAVVLVAALGLVPILVSALAGVVLMVATGCLKPGEIYDAVRWDVIFLLAGLIPLGVAMEKSGATHWLANNLLTLGSGLSGYWILLFFFVATSLLTEILSNNASVVIMIPIAVEVAKTLSLNPLAFMFAVTFAASNSFMTPIGYQTNTMVYGAGHYKFIDFFRVGAPLSLLMAIVTPLLIVLLYGL